jgi:hypothetical protein
MTIPNRPSLADLVHMPLGDIVALSGEILALLQEEADWFTDELAEIGSKDAAQQMCGVWIIEIAELDAIGRAEVSRIKSFLTRTIDRYRPPIGRYVINVPRQCVFAGSVNPDTYQASQPQHPTSRSPSERLWRAFACA